MAVNSDHLQKLKAFWEKQTNASDNERLQKIQYKEQPDIIAKLEKSLSLIQKMMNLLKNDRRKIEEIMESGWTQFALFWPGVDDHSRSEILKLLNKANDQMPAKEKSYLAKLDDLKVLLANKKETQPQGMSFSRFHQTKKDINSEILKTYAEVGDIQKSMLNELTTTYASCSKLITNLTFGNIKTIIGEGSAELIQLQNELDKTRQDELTLLYNRINNLKNETRPLKVIKDFVGDFCNSKLFHLPQNL